MSRAIVHTVIVKVWDDGALSVEGLVEHKELCVATLLNAADAVRNHHRTKKELMVPNRDVDIPEAKFK